MEKRTLERASCAQTTPTDGDGGRELCSLCFCLLLLMSCFSFWVQSPQQQSTDSVILVGYYFFMSWCESRPSGGRAHRFLIDCLNVVLFTTIPFFLNRLPVRLPALPLHVYIYMLHPAIARHERKPYCLHVRLVPFNFLDACNE